MINLNLKSNLLFNLGSFAVLPTLYLHRYDHFAGIKFKLLIILQTTNADLTCSS